MQPGAAARSCRFRRRRRPAGSRWIGRVVHVDCLRLGGLPRPVLKQGRVEGAGDHAHYTVLVPQATVFDLPDEQLVSLEIPLPDAQERYLRVTWDDHATAALPLPDVVTAHEVTATTAPEPLRADVPFERRPSRVGESRFRIRLPASGLPIVAFELVCGGGHLLRAAKVTEAQLRGDELVPVDLGHATLRRSTRDGLSASALRVPVEHARGKELDLVVDDGDNAPLDLQRVSAVFAPQPWIYLEPRGTAPLVAHYGNARLAKPHYDLEAARAGLEKVRPGLARWGDPRPSASPPPPAEFPPAVARTGAPLDIAGFAVTRAILVGPHPADGLAAVALDAPVLAHSRSLGDLRIRDESGHRIPFLLEHRDEPTLVNLVLERVDKDVPGGPRVEPKTSLYRIELPFATLPAGRLVLGTSSRVFQRHVTVLAPRSPTASARDPEVRTVDAREWTHADPDTSAPALALPWALPDTSTVYLRVDEGDNEPLALATARLELPGLRVRFFRSADARLTLLYGAPTLSAPRYDLALLAPTLAGAVADELALGPETTNTKAAPPAPMGMPVFWGVLIAAVAVLLLMMGAMLRRPGAPGA